MQSKQSDHDPLGELNLSTRTRNALIREGIRTIAQVKALAISDLLSMRGIGEFSVAEIKRAIRRRGGNGVGA